MYKQIIIARKDLAMSPGKLAAQVSHGSSAFLMSAVKQHISKVVHPQVGEGHAYEVTMPIDVEMYNQWFEDGCTKVVLGAKNKNHLMKAVAMAEELGLVGGKDFFLINDLCRTELTPEGPEGTLTVLGFRPLPAELIDQIGRKYHLL